MIALLKTTGEIVEVIAHNGVAAYRDPKDFVSYIDSKGIEHPIEELNYYWDFISVEDAVKDKEAKQALLSDNENDEFEFVYKPKFNVGDAIVDDEFNDVKIVSEISPDTFEYELDLVSCYSTERFDFVDNTYRLWDFNRDAYKGILLEDKKNNVIAMFKELIDTPNGQKFESWCYVDDGCELVTTKNVWSCKNFKPAGIVIKTLFQKILEVNGYKWDPESNSLKTKE